MATETYKYRGSKEPGRGSGPLILKGSVINPEESVEIGGTVELTEEQAKRYKAQGLDLRKTSEPDEDEPKGTDKPETEAEQLASQQPSAASPTPASAGKNK